MTRSFLLNEFRKEKTGKNTYNKQRHFSVKLVRKVKKCLSAYNVLQINKTF